MSEAFKTPDAQNYYAAINYVVNSREYVEFLDFEDMMRAAKNYAKVYHEVKRYDEEHTQAKAAAAASVGKGFDVEQA